MTTFTPHDLYGGAITADLPSTYIDASNIRQIPDHQEVFLSNKTLTSLIFEINEYQNQPDPAALYFHFTDVIAPPDRLAVDEEEGGFKAPTRPNLGKESLRSFPTYLVEGAIVSPDSGGRQQQNETADTKTTLTKCWQLVVRMEKYGTDFCVRLNVPFKELVEKGDAEAEETVAREVMDRIVATLDVKDFGLFGGV